MALSKNLLYQLNISYSSQSHFNSTHLLQPASQHHLVLSLVSHKFVDAPLSLSMLTPSLQFSFPRPSAEHNTPLLAPESGKLVIFTSLYITVGVHVLLVIQYIVYCLYAFIYNVNVVCINGGNQGVYQWLAKSHPVEFNNHSHSTCQHWGSNPGHNGGKPKG